MVCRELSFIENYKEYFQISKRYIKYSEIVEISERYKLDVGILNGEIIKANNLFIKSQIPIYLKEFKSFLFSRKLPINDKVRDELESKYKKDYFNFYHKLNFDKLIDVRTFLINESIKSGDLKEYNNLLFLSYIDKNKHEFLKDKYIKSNFYFNEMIFDEFLDDLNISIIDSQKSKYFKRFKSILYSCNKVINNKNRLKLKSKYNSSFYNFYDELNFDDLIDRHNISIIQSEGSDILYEFNSFLDSYINFIDDECYLKLKSKYNKDYCNYFEDFDFENKILKHNESVKSKIIKKVLKSYDGCISNSECLELKSKYEQIDWDYVVNHYNDAFINSYSNFVSNDILNGEKIDDSNINELDETIRGVYYLEDYIKPSYWHKYPQDRNISKCVLDYKDNDPKAIKYFTRRLMEAIVYISNNYLDENIDSIALISIPPSKINKNAHSPMRKSINLIKKCFDNQLIECNKLILDYGNLLYRYLNVKTSHKCRPEERPEKENHINSILCTKKDFAKDNMAFILMDDITTRGKIMYACENILLNNNVKRNNIYKLAIAETMWVY